MLELLLKQKTSLLSDLIATNQSKLNIQSYISLHPISTRVSDMQKQISELDHTLNFLEIMLSNCEKRIALAA